MLTEICAYLRNWFDRSRLYGDFRVTGGQLTCSDGSALPLLTGQYYRIIGSVFNDGVHVHPAELQDKEHPAELQDEEFNGAIWGMAIPPDFLTLAQEIEAWVEGNADAISSPYQSESFAGYSYSLKSGGSSDGTSNGVGWESQFASRLDPWRKI